MFSSCSIWEQDFYCFLACGFTQTIATSSVSSLVSRKLSFIVLNVAKFTRGPTDLKNAIAPTVALPMVGFVFKKALFSFPIFHFLAR
jgi:hypothetical protein